MTPGASDTVTPSDTVTAKVLVLSAAQREAAVLKVRLSPAELTPGGLNAAVREAAGLDAALLHDGGLSLGVRGGPVLMEVLEPLPAGRFELTRDWRLPSRARPWQRPGWLAAVSRWIAQALEARGETLGKVQQVSTYDLACVLRAETSRGGVYFKAGSDGLEAAVTAHLALEHPTLLPEVIAWDGAQNWLLTRDGGPRLSDTANLARWSEALAGLARYQLSAGGAELQALRCPAHSFAGFADRAGAFLEDARTLKAWGLMETQAAALCELVPLIRRAHARAAALALPEGPAHGDAQPMNALVGPTGCRWFDWSEASLAHPFMDVGWCLAWLAHPARDGLPLRQAHPGAVGQLWSAYLQALGLPRGEGLMPEAVILAMTHRALVYHDKYEQWRGTVPGWRPQYVPYYLRLLLKMAGLLTR